MRTRQTTASGERLIFLTCRCHECGFYDVPGEFQYCILIHHPFWHKQNRANPFGGAVAETELQEIQTIQVIIFPPALTVFFSDQCSSNVQSEVVDITAKLWAADEMTDEEAEELERQSNLLKYKLAMASSAVKEWGMQQALERIQDHENRRKWHDPAKSDQVKKVAMQMAPIAFGFMLLVGLASQVRIKIL
jgi:hypothetical protein